MRETRAAQLERLDELLRESKEEKPLSRFLEERGIEPPTEEENILSTVFAETVALARLWLLRGDPSDVMAVDQLKDRFLTFLREFGFSPKLQAGVNDLIEVGGGDWHDLASIKALYERFGEIFDIEYDFERLFKGR